MVFYEKSEHVIHVKFIRYTGRYPNLCSGELTIEVDGKIYTFGDSRSLPRFWMSGGSCGFLGSDYCESYVSEDEWNICADLLPEELRQYACEINEVFNECVPYGCCGGCL